MKNTTQVNPNTSLPMSDKEAVKEPKLATCRVGMFNLPGVKVDLEQYSQEDVKEMLSWAKDNGAYIVEERGLFSWKSEAKRDWFILRWT